MRHPKPGPIVITAGPYVDLPPIVICIETILRKFGLNPKIEGGIWESVTSERALTTRTIKRLYEDHCNVIQRVSGNPVICMGGLGDLAVRFPEWKESQSWQKRWRPRYRSVVIVGVSEEKGFDSAEELDLAVEFDDALYDAWQPDRAIRMYPTIGDRLALQIYHDWGNPYKLRRN